MQSLVHLDLSFNCITSIQPLQSLSRLHVLLASNNQLTSVAGVGGCESLNRLDVHDNKITVLSDVADAAKCPLLGTLNLSANPAQKCMDYRLHIVFLLPQVTNLDSLLVDEKEKVHAQNLHGADAEGLKRTRDHFFPHGEPSAAATAFRQQCSILMHGCYVSLIQHGKECCDIPSRW